MALPRTPVGAGASWLHTRSFDQSGIKMTTATTFELTAIDGDKISFQSATVVNGPDQAVTQAGTTIEIKNITGKGAGSGTIDLTRMVMNGELVAEFASDMSAQGENTRMGMKMATRLSPGSTRAPAAEIDPSTAGAGTAGSAEAGGAGSASDDPE
jgi:hypothetical protein